MPGCLVHEFTIDDPAAGVPPLRRIHPSSPVELPGNEIHLWQFDLDRPPDPPQVLEALLDEGERARADRFHFDVHRRRFIHRRGMRRVILARYVDAIPEAITFTLDGFGKPELATKDGAMDLRFNTSHAEDRSVCVVTRGRAIGVDIERRDRVGRIDWPGIASRFIHPREAEQLADADADARDEAHLRLWTVKEAFVKALGWGMSLPMCRVDASALIGGRVGVIRDERRHAWLCYGPPLHGPTIAAIVVDASRDPGSTP